MSWHEIGCERGYGWMDGWTVEEQASNARSEGRKKQSTQCGKKEAKQSEMQMYRMLRRRQSVCPADASQYAP